MSADEPDFSALARTLNDPAPDESRPVLHWTAPLKFQHKYPIHIVLFLLTLLTTTWAGTGWSGGPWTDAFWYSIPALAILGAHEFGHYFACRWHNVDATLPYFLPAPPFVLTGTFGAVIRIREAFPSKRALFDIGIAGPIAGFVALIPFLVWGVAHAPVMATPPGADVLQFGDPLLLKLVERLTLGPIPAGSDLIMTPMVFAAWFGMLATSLNLLPFGQLDGGHIAYAVAGRRAKWLSVITLGVTLALTTRSLSWLLTAVMMTAMAFFLGIRHPSVGGEDVPLSDGRRLLALAALVIFILCFTPVPITFLR